MKQPKINLTRCFVALLCTFIFNNVVFAQQNSAYTEYIRKYCSLAIDQMNRHRIPASITLSQGLLESAAGKSTLATEAHNHFGIKVGSGWDGPYIVRDDDAKGEHFRKYQTDAQSFEDHSLFLKKPRYASLFQLDIRDYQGWAHGLKACGYATSPTYAESLIRIIETYNLAQYDGTPVKGSYASNATGQRLTDRDLFFQSHPVRQCNGLYYIVVQPGDDLKTVSKMVGKRKRKLLSYNDLPKDSTLQPGTVLFLQSKRSKADKSLKGYPHVLQAGQSLYDVSQLYGIKLKSLYKLNHFAPDYTPVVGQTLRLY